MKKLILSAGAMLMLAACAKDYKCKCTQTSDMPGSVATTDETVLVETTKGQAKANCFNKTTTAVVGTVTVVYKEECTLSK